MVMRLTLERTFFSVLETGAALYFPLADKDLRTISYLFLRCEIVASGERACIDRWLLVQNKIKPLDPASFLDLGCAEGYFVLQAAQAFNCVSIGVDADIRRLTVATMASALNHSGAGFVDASIDLELLRKLPVFDVVMFLSVMHHVMYEHGVDHARNLLSAIRSKAGKCLIFDMGQSNETSHEWAALLPEMTPDPETWIKQFLRSAGFSTVETVGETDAYRVRLVAFRNFIAYP